jgi:hypothetical protein
MTRPNEITKLIDLLHEKCRSAVVSVDAPRDPKGEWWLDIADGRFRTAVSWLVDRGFGIFTSEEGGFGVRPDEFYRKPSDACERICQLRANWEDTRRIEPMRPRELRELLGTAQVELAAALKVNQAAVSRFESRTNIQIHSLAEYIEAMGGELELRAKFENFEARIEPAQERKVRG